jgi:hypothetical protein
MTGLVLGTTMKFMYTGYCTYAVLALKFQERSLSMLHQKKRKNSSKKDEGNNLEHT